MLVIVLLLSSSCLGVSRLSSVLQATPQSSLNSTYFEDVIADRYTRRGDIILGGLFQLHAYDDVMAVCRDLLTLPDLKNVEVMVFAIDQLNKNNSILPGITIGFDIFDTCQSSAVTLERVLRYLPTQRAFACKSPAFKCAGAITGVIGPARSTSSIQATSVLKSNFIPLISYMATVSELSNTNQYPYFLRTVPPDNLQAKVLLDVLLQMKWSFVSAVHSDDIYGQSGMSILRHLANDNGICFATVLEISSSYEDFYYDKIIDQLLRYHNATVVILFTQREDTEVLLNAAARKNAEGIFTWLATDGWGNFCDDPINTYNQKAAFGSLLVAPYTEHSPEFEKYFSSIVPSKSDNPWLIDYLVHFYDCNPETALDSESDAYSLSGVNDSRISCDDPSLMNGTDSSLMASLIINAVMAFAYSLDRIQKETCNVDESLCWRPNPEMQNKLMDYLLESSFYGPNGPVSFDEHGDSRGKYLIRNVQYNKNDGYKCTNVGSWEESDGDDQDAKVQMYGSIQFYRNETWTVYDPGSESGDIPVSICSAPCKEDEIKTVIENAPCCWICSVCQDWEVIRRGGTRCRACPRYSWPNENKTRCDRIEPSYLYNWSPSLCVILLIVSSIGVLATMLTCTFYIRHHNVPLIKASGRELCHLILLGITASFVMTYFYIFEPTDVLCFLRRFSSVSYTMVFGTLVTKTNRVYRIFRWGRRTTRRPPFISPLSQIVISLILIVLQKVVRRAFINCVDQKIVRTLRVSTTPTDEMDAHFGYPPRSQTPILQQI
ncbi:metabotropic glutamate receptor 3-like [Glandiceps talaboti]